MGLYLNKPSLSLKDLAYYTMLFSMFVLFTRPAINGGDIAFWSNWTSYIFEHGLSNAYQNEVNNYNPLYQYILYLYTLLVGNKDGINHYLSFLKAFTLVFDFVGAIVAASLVKEKERRFALSFLLLFNAGYLYNTLIWVQVDAIFTCLAFIAVVMAFKRQSVWSLLFYVLALNAKTQAIIFLPILLFLWVPLWVMSLKSFANAIAAAVALQVLILVPFMWFSEQNGLPRIIDINLNTVHMYPFVSMNAHNFWCLVIDIFPLTALPDNLLYAGITYKTWGLLLFCLFSGIVLLPVFLLTIRNIILKQDFQRQHLALLLLSCGLIPICFCFFNTQMHERYWHSAILFLAASAFLTRNYIIYIIASVAYFLNLESVMQFLNMRKYTVFIFHPDLVAGMFAIVLLLGIWQLYKLAELKNWWLEIMQKKDYKVVENQIA